MGPEVTFWIATVAVVIGLGLAAVTGGAGIALIWIAALIYAIAEGFTTLTPAAFGAITLLAIIGLVADFFITNAATKISGASWQATIAGAIGGIVGFLFGLIVGGIGAAPAGIIGALIGVIGVEYLHRRDIGAAARAAGGWLAGCLASRVMQFLIALLMAVIFVVVAGFRGVWG